MLRRRRISGNGVPTEAVNSLLLLAEAVAYFGVMAVLFRWRARVGVGLFLCALGVMHFLETYLASVFYIALPFGVVSPGSVVLFSGKLVMLLLLYIKEDAATVRQPIYGLLIGNFLMVGLVMILRQHIVVVLPDGKAPDIAFIDEMGWLMVWGTSLLFVDSIFIILLYEKLGRWLARLPLLRIAIAVCCVLTFDQVGFYTVLRWLTGAPIEVFIGGWAAKMGAGLLFSALLVAYLRWFELPGTQSARGIGDVFEMLTYREKYEALVEHAGRDSLTGLLHRGRFESLGQQAVAASQQSGRPLTLLLLDVDHFKAINDRFGHAEGDKVLKSIADVLMRSAEPDHHVFRIGGEEFALLCPMPHAIGRLLAENIRQAIRLAHEAGPTSLTVSAGVATVGAGTNGLADLFAEADKRLYHAKASGRDRVVGESRPQAIYVPPRGAGKVSM